jgi:uncharacterized phage infection (PIP) family protein YhgE
MSNELALTVEQRVTALESKLTEEIDRLYQNVLPELDEEILKVSKRASQIGLTALDTYNDTVQQIRLAEQGIKQANEFTEQTIQVKLTDVVNRLIEQSSSEVVAVALMKALKNTILKTRPASREEVKTGENVFAIRIASSHEINHQS